jgi:uncharacterized membrane protein (DUF106 family)
MRFPYFSKRKADAISNGFLLILLGILYYTGAWWPGILLAIAASFGLRQYLTGRRMDFLITLVIIAFIGLIIISGFAFNFLVPAILIGCGLYMILREYYFFDGKRFKEINRMNDKFKE